MKSISLKGKGNEYLLEINSDSNFDQAMADLNELLQKLKSNSPVNSKNIAIKIDTEMRLLSKVQLDRIKTIIGKYDLFNLDGVTSQVKDQTSISRFFNKNKMNIETRIIRSGKVVQYEGDLLLLGDVHKGGQVQATGDIYVVGNVEGIIQAGYPSNNDAVIVGDIKNASQIRISDLVGIVADIPSENIGQKHFSYVNDLHVIQQSDINHFEDIRPKHEVIFNKEVI